MKRKLTTELDREMVIGQIKRLDLSRSYSVEILQKRIIRTIPQNRLYRLWLVCIGAETGNDPDVLHEFFKEKYLEPEIINVFGENKKRYTTTNLSTVQFKNYLDKIQVFASAELSITLPDPDDRNWEDFFAYYSEKL